MSEEIRVGRDIAKESREVIELIETSIIAASCEEDRATIITSSLKLNKFLCAAVESMCNYSEEQEKEIERLNATISDALKRVREFAAEAALKRGY